MKKYLSLDLHIVVLVVVLIVIEASNYGVVLVVGIVVVVVIEASSYVVVVVKYLEWHIPVTVYTSIDNSID